MTPRKTPRPLPHPDLEAAIEHARQLRTHLYNLRRDMPQTEDVRETVNDVVADLERIKQGL